jgi:hypothetical protein
MLEVPKPSYNTKAQVININRMVIQKRSDSQVMRHIANAYVVYILY